ncbi:MAG: putative DNA binding domain-containing protein [Oscillospiraceae bacterium]|nr:putative DNA binding domain-containing protein [Oscillospiraceae bacterium]
MPDILHLEKYKENNRIEAKKSKGGLPKSVWETYSSFANTQGGVILLGVEELPDKSLSAVGIDNADEIIKNFWDIVNNANKVSVNILSDKNVKTETVDGKAVIVITVPRAVRSDRPVYINGNPMNGTYRRNGEGDYKCSSEEVRAMLRDASVQSQDMLVLENMGLDVFDFDSVHRYRQRMVSHRPGHVWEELDDKDFLYKLGALGRGSNGELRPTAAGLLMFGFDYEIVKEYPNYFLDYQEKFDESKRWTDRIASGTGEWNGNIYDFYFKVYNKLTQNIKIPFELDKGSRVEDTDIHKALREAIANCLINADYYGRQGIVIVQSSLEINISNPGGFRVELEAAKAGGVSDPRNATLMKFFNLIGISERAGSGIQNIYSVWKKQGFDEPLLCEETEPERTIMKLFTEKVGDKKSAIKIGDKKSAINEEKKQQIIDYLMKNGKAKTSEIADLLGLQSSRTRDYLNALVDEGKIIADGENKNRVYRLK